MAKTREILIKEVAEAQAALQATRDDSLRQIQAASVELQLAKQVHAAELQEIHEAHNKHVAEMDKAIKSANDVKKMYSDRADEYSRELEMTHLVIDTLAGAPPRELKAKPDDYAATKLSLVARLAGYLAIRP